MQNVEKVRDLKQFTIIIRAKLFASKKQIMTLVGHSGCGGWAMVISDTDEV